MAKRYRTFKRVALTAKTARLMVECLVDKTFEDHFATVECVFCRTRGPHTRGHCDICSGLGRVPKCRDKMNCWHVESGNLAVARLVEVGMTVGVKRARLDISDEPETAKLFAERLLDFARDDKDVKNAGAAPAFERTAEIARKWANRSPLERLAEAGLELD